MSYCIGLDCGITSVGYAVLELDSNEEPCRIISLGSRVFPAAENPKDGSSLALPRREKRGQRRRIRRKRHRNERIRNLIVSSGILTQEELNKLFEGKGLSDIYQIRYEALSRKLTNQEFARVLIHLSQRRGFKSNRKNVKENDDEGKLLSAVTENSKLLENYETVADMFLHDEKFTDTKRNKVENYACTVSRAMVFDEICKIFEAQRNLGNSLATSELEDDYVAIVMSQRDFAEGPGGDSKYGGNQIEKMMGNCTLIPEEKRAVKGSYSFQVFNLWQNINNIRITKNGSRRSLTDSERKAIYDKCFASPDVTYTNLRKVINLSDDEFFVGLDYRKGTEEAEKKKFNFLKEYHEIRKALNKVTKNRIAHYSENELNEIGKIFTIYKDDEKIKAALKEAGVEQVDIDALLKMPSFKKVGHISVKACDMLIPFLKQGMKYNEACDAAGLNFRAHDKSVSKFLPGYSDEILTLVNPVVRRAVSQTIKVINAIIREQNESPMFVNIELAREMSKDFFERRDIKKSQDENHSGNQRIVNEIKENFNIPSPKGLDIIKLRLWREQGEHSLYSGEKIEYERLFEVGYVDVDHIIPYSVSFDDSYSNKVLVLTHENRQKGNQLPLQYLKGKERDNYIVRVNCKIKNHSKKQKLLKEHLDESDEGFKERNLNDTRYLSRFLYNYINDRLEFAPSLTSRKKRVTAVNGAITSYIRKRLGIAKIREDGDLHHAADAAVIACVTDGMINRISRYHKNKEIGYAEDEKGGTSIAVSRRTGEVLGHFPEPWPNFRKELEIRLSNDPQSIIKDVILPNYTSEQALAVKPCFVSRMPNRKTKGAAHADTVRSPKLLDEGLVISKVPLTKLKLDKNGEIENYYNPESDKLLYEALKTRLAQFGGDGEKAFKGVTEFRKPTSSGKEGPIVKKVKVCEKSSLTVPVNDGKGVAQNDTMIRVDVFHIENDGYYFVPIYVADAVKEELPDKACTRNKNYEDWLVISDKDFCFSLYPNDLMFVKSERGLKFALKQKNSTLPENHLSKEELIYYTGMDVSVGCLSGVTHDGTYGIRTIGKTIDSIEKYEVDPLGNYWKVGKEKRQKIGG